MLGPDLGQELGRRGVAGEQLRRISRRKAYQEKGDRDDDEQKRHGHDQPANAEPDQVAAQCDLPGDWALANVRERNAAFLRCRLPFRTWPRNRTVLASPAPAIWTA